MAFLARRSFLPASSSCPVAALFLITLEGCLFISAELILCWFLYSFVISNKKCTQAHKTQKMEFLYFFFSFGGKFSCAGKVDARRRKVFTGLFRLDGKGKHQDYTQSSCGCDEQNFIEANFNIVFYEGKSLLLCVSFSLSLFEYLLVYFLSLRRRRKVYQCKSLLFISRPRQELFSSAMKIWILASKWWLWVVGGS